MKCRIFAYLVVTAATLLFIPSASATDDPPYFCTTRATADPLLPVALMAGGRPECTEPGPALAEPFLARPACLARPAV